jgi:hypothetical protein
MGKLWNGFETEVHTTSFFNDKGKTVPELIKHPATEICGGLAV